MKVEIYILTNREIPHAYSSIYHPLYLGKGWKHKENARYEESGENIADKHELYADLGGFYWIWKNSGADVIGIDQYRKYFISAKNPGLFIQEEEILSLLSEYDIIVPPAFTANNETILEKYERNTHIRDLQTAREILSSMYPDYIDGFDFIMAGYRMYGMNMWIASKKVFDSYCSWIFPLLSEAEKRVDVSNYPRGHKRVLAFLSEYLFTVWLLHQNLKVYELTLNVVADKGQTPAEELIRKMCGMED